MKNTKNLSIILISLFLILSILPTTIFSSEDGVFDAERDTEFTIYYQYEGKPIPGAEFAIYKVAEADANFNLTILDEFKDFPIGDLSKITQDEWNKYAETLKAHALREGIKPIATGVTDAEGKYTTKLKPGLYLVVGKDVKIDGFLYRTNPYLVLLPSLEMETGKWDYEVLSKPKAGREELPTKRYISKKVIKIWKDNGFEQFRPKEVVIELLGNGRVIDRVVLSERNNWKHTWRYLDPDVEWTVVERIERRSGYTVAIYRDGDTFIVENTYEPHYPPEKPEDPKEPKNPPPEVPETPGEVPPIPELPPTPPSEVPPTPGEPGKPILPQTGQLWWPVFLLVGLGSIMLVLGLIQNRKKRCKDEN